MRETKMLMKLWAKKYSKGCIGQSLRKVLYEELYQMCAQLSWNCPEVCDHLELHWKKGSHFTWQSVGYKIYEASKLHISAELCATTCKEVQRVLKIPFDNKSINVLRYNKGSLSRITALVTGFGWYLQMLPRVSRWASR